MSQLIVERAGAIVRVTLNRPEVRNAFNEGLIAELTAWARSVKPGPETRVAVLAGAGRAFCAGADLAWMAKMVSYSHEENVRDARALADMFEALDALPIPLVGRIHGAALGGGAGLAAICDIAVAAEDTAFGFTEVKLGIIPAVIAPYVIGTIGASAARELFLTGGRFSAIRAKEIGLVHAVGEEADLDRLIARYTTDVQTAGPHAVAAAKALVAELSRQDRTAAIEYTIDAIAERRVSPEGQEGMRAFLDKRKPSWTP